MRTTSGTTTPSAGRLPRLRGAVAAMDAKNQAYPPHGSVPVSKVAGKSGQDFTASGQIVDAKGNTLNFQLKCVIA